jgi:hypothetical protein
MNRALVVFKRQIPEVPGCGGVVKHFLLALVEIQLQPPGFMDKLIAKNMVQMAVRVDQLYGLKALGCNFFFQTFTLFREITARIYNQGIPRFVIDKVGILLNGAEE